MKEKVVDGMVYIRSEDIFYCPIKDIIDAVTDLPNRTRYDDGFKCGEYLIKVSDTLQVIRQEFHGLLMVQGRDMIMVAGVIFENNKVYIIAKGIKEDEKFPPKKKIVRGFLEVGGWILEKIDDESCKAIYLVKNDCNGKEGKLSPSLQTMAAKDQAKGFVKLKKILEKQHKNRKK